MHVIALLICVDTKDHGVGVMLEVSRRILAARDTSTLPIVPIERIAAEWDSFRDLASAAVVFVLPGICATQKLQGSVRCFSRKSPVMDISSNIQLPKIFSNGLWSMTTNKSEPLE